MALILCVEDETLIREDIAELMDSAGHTSLQACDGKEALKMITKYNPDLVLSDITMPVMDGNALLQEVRKSYPQFASTPFIFLSALANREDIMDGIKLGADDYITKPIDFDMLLNKVDSSLRQVERMKAEKDLQFVKLFKALTEDTVAEPVSVPIAKPEPTNSKILARSKDQTGTAREASTQNLASNNKQKIFGNIFQFRNFSDASGQVEERRRSILGWLYDKSYNFLNRGLSNGAAVIKIPNDGGIVVGYLDGDKDKAIKQSKHLAKKLENNLLNGQLDEIAKKVSISRDELAHLVVVTETLYETEISPEDLTDPQRFSAAVMAQIKEIHSDETAPEKLISSIRRNFGHLIPLNLIDRHAILLPLKFYNFDDESSQKIRSSFAVFKKENLITAECLIDLLILELLEREINRVDKGETIVVDVHFKTLKSTEYCGKYMAAFAKFSYQCQNNMIINICNIPSKITKLQVNKVLKPLGKYACRRMVQIVPQLIGSQEFDHLKISTIVCTYSGLVNSNIDFSLISKAKQYLSKSGILLILRGLPSEKEISKFRKYQFDGFAVTAGK